MVNCLNSTIRQLRITHGFSQVEFAKLIGVTKQCVSNWENDNVLPSIEMLIKIADLFQVSTEYLLGRSHKITLDVSDLTADQIGHISLVIRDLSLLNKQSAK